MRKRVKCPTCGAAIEWSRDNRWRPFCSERCRLIDLGEWFEERRTIPGDRALEQIEPHAGRGRKG